MSTGFGQPTSRSTQNSSFSTNSNNDAGDFECNICFDIAQEPIITLCGHLFCWPCLYKWLHIHSLSQECPVCKALIQEEKLVPLYGRGKNSTDPRSKSIPGVEIPNRPTGQRPETAPPPNTNPFEQNGFGFMGGSGGFAPTIRTRFGNFTFLSAFGFPLPSLLGVHLSGFNHANVSGSAGVFPYGGYSSVFHGPNPILGLRQPTSQQQQADFTLMILALLVGFSVVLALFWT